MGNPFDMVALEEPTTANPFDAVEVDIPPVRPQGPSVSGSTLTRLPPDQASGTRAETPRQISPKVQGTGPSRPGIKGAATDLGVALGEGTASVWAGLGEGMQIVERLITGETAADMLRSTAPIGNLGSQYGLGGPSMLEKPAAPKPEVPWYRFYQQYTPGELVAEFGKRQQAESSGLSRQAQESTPYDLRWWLVKTGQQAPQLAAMIASGKAWGRVGSLGMIGTMEAGGVRQTVEEQLTAGGMDPAEARLRADAAGAAAGVVNALLENTPYEEFVEGPAQKSLLIGLIRGFAANGPIEGVQEMVSYTAERQAGLPPDPDVSSRIMQAALVGGATGGAFGGARAVAAKAGTAGDGTRTEIDQAQPPEAPAGQPNPFDQVALEPKETEHAETVRVDAGQVPAAGAVAEGGASQGRTDLQQPPQTEGGAGEQVEQAAQAPTEEVAPRSLPQEAWRTPVIPGRESLASLQAEGLPVGTFYALDRPFESGAHDPAQARRAQLPAVRNVYDPDGLLGKPSPSLSAEVAQAMEEARRARQGTRRAYARVLRDHGYDAYVRGIDGDPQNRELIVLPEYTSPVAPAVAAESAAPAAPAAPEGPAQPAAQKQPWEVTREEFSRQSHKVTPTGREAYYHFSDGRKMLGPRNKSIVPMAHEYAVRDAIQSGQPVPLSVLSDYRGQPWADAALAKLEGTQKQPPRAERAALEEEIVRYARQGTLEDEEFAESGQFEEGRRDEEGSPILSEGGQSRATPTFRFRGKFPGEVLDRLPRNKRGQPYVPIHWSKAGLKQNSPGGEAENFAREIGYDAFFRLIERGAAGRKGDMARAVDSAERFARGTGDVEMYRKIQRYRLLGQNLQPDEMETETVTVEPGDVFQDNGERFKVIDAQGQTVTVKDGVEGVRENPVEVDKGTLRKGEAMDDIAGMQEFGPDAYLSPEEEAELAGQAPEAEPPTFQADLFGRPVFAPVAGQQQTLGLEPGETTGRAAGSVEIKTALASEVAKLANEPGVDDAKTALLALRVKYKAQADKFFKNPSDPMPEVEEAWGRATRGGAMFAEETGSTSGAMGYPVGRAVDHNRIEVAEQPGAGRPISAGEILRYVQAAFKTPIRGRATHQMLQTLGKYFTRQMGIRMKDARSLATAMHEIGHHIDWGLSGRISMKVPAPVKAELLRLGKALYGNRKPHGGYKSEGFAEFVRMYLTADDAATQAPIAHEWFIKTYLPGHEAIGRKLAQVRKLIDRFRLQGAEKMVEAFINREPIRGTIRQQFRRAMLWLNTNFIDELAPLRRGMEEAGIGRASLNPAQDPYELAVAYADKAPAIARHFVLEYTTDPAGNRTGGSLRDALAPVAADIKAFTRYAAAARALLLHDRGINPGIDRGIAQYVYDTHDSPEFQKALSDVTDWNHRILDYAGEAGAMAPDAIAAMKKLNPIYVPFLRAFTQGEIRSGGGIGRGLAEYGKPVKAIKGSGREIIDPFESMIVQAQRIIGAAHKARVARALVNLEAKHRGLASLIWEVPPPIQATQLTAEQIKRNVVELAVKYLGVDPGEVSAGMMENWDDLLTVYSNAADYRGKDNILSLMVNGERHWYEVSPDLYRVLRGLDQYTLPRALDFVLGRPARLVRLGATGLNPAFGLLRNFIRDAATFSILAEHARFGPLSAAAGVVSDVARTKSAQRFKAMGGKMSGQLLHDRTSSQHMRGEALASSVGGKAIHHVTHPIQALRELFGITEAGTRIAEFSAALRYAEDRWGVGSLDAAIYALNKAQDVTTNFTRHGRLGKIINQMVPFFNASIQGPEKAYRSFKARPAQTGLAALFYGTLPALLLWWRNRDEEWYKELPTYERANYLHFQIPGTNIVVRIPIPFELGHIFQTLPVAAADAAYRKDPDGFKATMGAALESDIPGDWPPLPAVIKPLVEVGQNRDWSGRPIVPARLERAQAKDQHNPYTTVLMREVGRVIGYSPAKLEYLVNSYSGGLYGRLSHTAERAGAEGMPSDYPVIGTLLVRDPYAPKQSVEQFYDRRDVLVAKKASGEISVAEDAERLDLERTARKLSPLWSMLRGERDEAQRKYVYGQIKNLIDGGMAREPATQGQDAARLVHDLAGEKLTDGEREVLLERVRRQSISLLDAEKLLRDYHFKFSPSIRGSGMAARKDAYRQNLARLRALSRNWPTTEKGQP